MSSITDKNGCDKIVNIKTEQNEDVIDQVSEESVTLKVDVPENKTTEMDESKWKKNVYKNEATFESNEYFEENDLQMVIKSEEDFNILNGNIAVLVQLEKTAEEKTIAEFKQKKIIIDKIVCEVVKQNAQKVVSIKELEAKDALIKVLENRLIEEQQSQAKELEVCMNQVLEKESQVHQKNEKIAELEDTIQNQIFQLKDNPDPPTENLRTHHGKTKHGQTAEGNEKKILDEDNREAQNCTECPKKFLWTLNREKMISLHMFFMHNKSKSSSDTEDQKGPKKCTECWKIFVWSPHRERKINSHMKKIHKLVVGPVEAKKPSKVDCKLCYREFKGSAGKKNLNIHQYKVHQEDLHHLSALSKSQPEVSLDAECPICDLKFINSSILTYHVNFAHWEDQGPSKTQLDESQEEIEKSIAELEESIRNMEKKTAETPKEPENVVCCNKTFETVKKLKKHTSNTHTKYKDSIYQKSKRLRRDV